MWRQPPSVGRACAAGQMPCWPAQQGKCLVGLRGRRSTSQQERRAVLDWTAEGGCPHTIVNSSCRSTDSQMLSPYIIRREYRHKLRRSRSFFYCNTSPSLFALYQAHDSNDFESKFACGFNRLDRRAAGGAHIINNYDSCTFLLKAFYAPPHTVLLLSFPHQESVHASAGHSHGHYDRVGSHGESANGLRIPAPRPNLFQKDFAGQLSAASVQRSGAAINVVIARPARSQFELTQTKRLRRQQA